MLDSCFLVLPSSVMLECKIIWKLYVLYIILEWNFTIINVTEIQ
jgi:hypothetical protein